MCSKYCATFLEQLNYDQIIIEKSAEERAEIR